MFKVQGSRRSVGLKPADYDHQISLVDHDGSQPQRLTSTASHNTELTRSSTTSRLIQPHQQRRRSGEINGQQSNGSAASSLSPRRQRASEDSNVKHNTLPHSQDTAVESQSQSDLPHPALEPSIEIHVPTHDAFHGDRPNVKPKKPKIERETAIDILYENERGLFLCGRPLFSAAALGGLDATAWSNAYHKPSPTSIQTATVPDPSWEWTWPHWRVNHQEGMDDEGWEYSFAFSRKFSWHGGNWWSSFVRRRAWIRKRFRRDEDELASDSHMLNSDYFTVLPASERTGRSRDSIISMRASRASMTQVSSIAPIEEKPDLEDIDMLMQALRAARVDREKLEAVENYLHHATDLAQLGKEMHEIMGTFIFQASRRTLLSRLMQLYEKTADAKTTDEKKNSNEQEKEEIDGAIPHGRAADLHSAVEHADKEVRRLAYWSDIKGMAEHGETRGAADSDMGWHDGWQGVDQSGPLEPNKGKLPA